jgi:hypothetical protein
MATRLITEGEFRSSRYGQLADQIEGRLSDLIESAESYIESAVDRKLSRDTYTEFAEVGQSSLFLRQSPIIAVTAVEMKNSGRETGWDLIDAERYQVLDSLGIVEFRERLNPRGTYRVKYDAGYEPIPPIIKTATILQTAYFAYQDFEIYGSGDGKPPGITYIQKEVDRYIAAFVRKKLV